MAAEHVQSDAQQAAMRAGVPEEHVNWFVLGYMQGYTAALGEELLALQQRLPK